MNLFSWLKKRKETKPQPTINRSPSVISTEPETNIADTIVTAVIINSIISDPPERQEPEEPKIYEHTSTPFVDHTPQYSTHDCSCDSSSSDSSSCDCGSND